MYKIQCNNFLKQTNIRTKIRLNISDPVKILNNIANSQDSINKTVVEFIDNSIDASTEVDNLKPITLEFSKKKKYISFLDFHKGMNLQNFLNKIGDSEKINQVNTNGKFGFGVQSFRSISDDIIIQSKLSGENTFYLKINSEDREVDEPKESYHELFNKNSEMSGTQIKLENLKDQFINQLNFDSISDQLQMHFSMLFQYRGLTLIIKNIDNGKQISIDNKFKSQKSSDKLILDESFEENNISVKTKIYLKSTSLESDSDVNLYLNDRFISKLDYLKSFKRFTKRKSLWTSSHIHGQIRAFGPNPTLTRDDIAFNSSRTTLQKQIQSVEEVIIKEIQSIDQIQNQQNFEKILKILNDSFHQYQKQSSSIKDQNNTIKIYESDLKNSETKDQSKKSNKMETVKKEISKNEQYKNLFNISFLEKEEFVKYASNEKHSVLIGNMIMINRDHSDLIEHLTFEDDTVKFRQSAISFLSTIISFRIFEIYKKQNNKFEVQELENLILFMNNQMKKKLKIQN